MKSTFKKTIENYVENGVHKKVITETYEEKGIPGNKIGSILLKFIAVAGPTLIPLLIDIFNGERENSSPAADSPACDQLPLSTEAPLRESKVYGHHKTEGDDNPPKFLVENIRRGGVNIVAGPSGSCKSILVVQILTAIALGFRSIFEVVSDAVSNFKGQKTFLYNSEGLVEDWEDRYCTGGNNPPIEVVHKKACRFSSVQELVQDIRNRVKHYGKDCTVALDNLTRFFPCISDTLVIDLFDGLESIQGEMEQVGAIVTFIIASHTNDKIPSWKGIFEQSLRGSGNLVRFSDYTIGVNHSRFGKTVKYIKPMKERQSGTDVVQKVQWNDTPYWHLEYDGEYLEDAVKPFRPKTMAEGNAVDNPPEDKGKRPTAEDRETIERMRAEGKSGKTIASALDVSVRTYYNYLDKLGLRK